VTDRDAARLASREGANYGDVVEVHASGFTGDELRNKK
jgi:hypothetical protein